MSQVKRNVSIRYEDGEFRFKFASDDTDNTHDTDDLELLNLWDEVLSEVSSSAGQLCSRSWRARRGPGPPSGWSRIDGRAH